MQNIYNIVKQLTEENKKLRGYKKQAIELWENAEEALELCINAKKCLHEEISQIKASLKETQELLLKERNINSISRHRIRNCELSDFADGYAVEDFAFNYDEKAKKSIKKSTTKKAFKRTSQ